MADEEKDKPDGSTLIEVGDCLVPLGQVITMAQEMCRALSGVDVQAGQIALLIAFTQVVGAAELWYTDPLRMKRIHAVVQTLLHDAKRAIEQVDKMTPEQIGLSVHWIDKRQKVM